ncbi:MAG: hypothetical protein HYY52_07735 [Candidatus Melainabacteria bacterium]|nr:hypothetical protein [Candidatus Melainabacteria bacterium]
MFILEIDRVNNFILGLPSGIQGDLNGDGILDTAQFSLSSQAGRAGTSSQSSDSDDRRIAAEVQAELSSISQTVTVSGGGSNVHSSARQAAAAYGKAANAAKKAATIQNLNIANPLVSMAVSAVAFFSQMFDMWNILIKENTKKLKESVDSTRAAR